MKNILLIAGITYKEAVRNKLLNVLVLFAIIAIASTRFFTIFAPSEEIKIIQDTSLGIIRFIGMLITVFVTGGLLPREIERRTVTTILSKPVTRTQFLFGKFCGALYAIFVNLIIMTVFLMLLLYVKSRIFNIDLLKAILLMSGEFVVLCSITLCVSTLASEIFNIIFGILIFIIGHLTNYLQHMAGRFESVAMKAILWSLYTALPNFENFKIQNAIVLGTKVSVQYVGKVLAYGALYTTIMLCLGYLFFAEREV